MSFASPWLLLFLLLVPLAIGGYVLLERRRSRAGPRAGRRPCCCRTWFRRARAAGATSRSSLFMLALILLLAGFARPQANDRRPARGRDRRAGDRRLGLDGGEGRQADAGSAPRAPRQLQFVKDLPDKYRVSLVTFSDHATVRVPPTYDHDQVARALPLKAQPAGHRARDRHRHGGHGRASARSASGSPASRRSPSAVLLLSDGAQTSGAGRPGCDSAAKARKLGIPISTVSLGTSQGRRRHTRSRWRRT